MHEGVQRYNVPEIQEIVQRLPNQGERVAEGDSNSFNVVVGVAPIDLYLPWFHTCPNTHGCRPTNRRGEEITTRIHDVCGRHCISRR